jgi:hypothetical protein
MSEPLVTYLHDHLAGSNFAIDLVGSLRDHYSNEPLGEFASRLLVELEEERTLLKQIVDRFGKGSPDIKEAAAWVMEKLSRFKLSHEPAKALGTFEALETLALGILGRIKLWRALAVIAETDDRLQDLNFGELITRAEVQHDEVEQNRLLVVRKALAPGKTNLA